MLHDIPLDNTDKDISIAELFAQWQDFALDSSGSDMSDSVVDVESTHCKLNGL